MARVAQRPRQVVQIERHSRSRTGHTKASQQPVVSPTGPDRFTWPLGEQLEGHAGVVFEVPGFPEVNYHVRRQGSSRRYLPKLPQLVQGSCGSGIAEDLLRASPDLASPMQGGELPQGGNNASAEPAGLGAARQDRRILERQGFDQVGAGIRPHAIEQRLRNTHMTDVEHEPIEPGGPHRRAGHPNDFEITFGGVTAKKLDASLGYLPVPPRPRPASAQHRPLVTQPGRPRSVRQARHQKSRHLGSHVRTQRDNFPSFRLDELENLVRIQTAQPPLQYRGVLERRKHHRLVAEQLERGGQPASERSTFARLLGQQIPHPRGKWVLEPQRSATIGPPRRTGGEIAHGVINGSVSGAKSATREHARSPGAVQRLIRRFSFPTPLCAGAKQCMCWPMSSLPDRTPDVAEYGAERDGQRQKLNRRVFMQLVVIEVTSELGVAEFQRSLAESLERRGAAAVIYQDLQHPGGLGILSWSENPTDLITRFRPALGDHSAGLRVRPEMGMVGRTYSSGFENDLEYWLLQRPVQTVLNDDWNWAIWYPLRRTPQFERLEAKEKGSIMREHAVIGKAYGDADLAHDVRLACHGLDANDNDFVIGLIGRDLHPLSHVVQSMRRTRQTSEYLTNLGPFFVGRAVWRCAGR